jgi:hypothetical protein
MSIQAALVDYAQELEEVSKNSGLEYLQGLREKCIAAIQNGSSLEYISSTVNGNTFNAQVVLSSADMFVAVQAAIRELRGNAVKLTYATFSNIPH